MITLGTIFIILMAYAGIQNLRGRLESSTGLLWVLMLAFPFPYIANTLGWMTAELGRQPWLIYGLFRTVDGYSKVVSSGDTVFTLIGFVGLYFVLGVLFLVLVGREISHGPGDARTGRTWRGAVCMIATWYGIAGFMLIVYVVLDGRNFGAGMLHWLVARTPEERRQVIAAIGPLWSWHEVWLVGFGGTVLAVFPKLLASAFAGYYLALFLILWCLILRGISLEVGGHINDRMWQGFWDFVFVVANTLLAILFGAAAGNLARGVPLASDGTFSMAFFTDFTPRGYVGLLDWYTVSVALFAAVALAAHGATYLTLKTEGAVHDRSAGYARVLWAAAAPLLLVISVESAVVRPDLLGHAIHNPFWWLGLLLVCAAAITLISGLATRREMRAFIGSNLLLAGLLATGAAAIFPVVLHSTLAPENSLTAYDVAAGPNSLAYAAIWWPIGFALAAAYFVFVSRRYAGKVSVKRDNQGFY